MIEEALKTVELSIELKNFLKTKDLSEKETKLSNAGNDSGNEVISSTALSVKDEKRSKKEKKNKKEKKEKEAKKEQKLSNGSLKSEGVENCANNSIGYNAENKGKGISAAAVKGSEPACKSGVGFNNKLIHIAANTTETKNASRSYFGLPSCFTVSSILENIVSSCCHPLLSSCVSCNVPIA